MYNHFGSQKETLSLKIGQYKYKNEKKDRKCCDKENKSISLQ